MSEPFVRRLTAAATAAMLALVLAGSSVSAAPPPANRPADPPGNPIVIREAFPSKGGAFWPSYVAQAEGFYTSEGIDFREILLDPNLTISALIGNGVEMAYADSTQLLYALEKHADLVGVGLSTDRHPYRLMATPSVKSLADLKGRKIGAASEIDIYTYVIREMLRRAGLDPDKDVEFVIGGNQTRRLAALGAGAIDAGLFSPPSDSRLRAQGFNALAFAPDYFPNLTLSAESVRRDWARKNGDALRRVLRAQGRAVQWLNDPAHKPRALQVFIANVGGSAADAEEAYVYYIGNHVWSDACIHQPGLVNVVKIMRTTNQLKTLTEADVPKFVDASWCPA